MSQNENKAAVETIIAAENQTEAEKVFNEIFKELTPAQQKEMISFAQGLRFANNLNRNKESA